MNSPSVIDMSKAGERKESARQAMVPTPGSSPSEIMALALQRGADLNQLKGLMELQERWEANQARKAFDAAISLAKAEIKPVLKNREVDFTNKEGKRTNYKHEDFAQIAREVDPILGQHGLSYRHRSKQDGNRLTIVCRVAHEAGHFEETELTADNDQSGNKNSIQGIGSTATYLQRYTLKIALGIAASVDDDGRTGGAADAPKITESQAADLKALITEHGGNMGKLLTYFKIRSLDEILAINYRWAVDEVRRLATVAADARKKP